MKRLAALISLITFGGGPFVLLWAERRLGTYDRDPIDWSEGNHGPWWNSWEEGYLAIDVLVWFIFTLILGTRAIRDRRLDGRKWQKSGCVLTLVFGVLFLSHLWFLAGAIS